MSRNGFMSIRISVEIVRVAARTSFACICGLLLVLTGCSGDTPTAPPRSQQYRQDPLLPPTPHKPVCRHGAARRWRDSLWVSGVAALVLAALALSRYRWGVQQGMQRWGFLTIMTLLGCASFFLRASPLQGGSSRDGGFPASATGRAHKRQPRSGRKSGIPHGGHERGCPRPAGRQNMSPSRAREISTGDISTH
jgi:hypothetical protein